MNKKNMKKITKENIYEFIDYYHFLHDSCIKKLNYNPTESKIDAIFNVYWNGKSTIKKDGNYDTYITKIRMIFTNIENFSYNEKHNSIDNSFVECYKKNGKDLICISLQSTDPDEEPYLYIACEKIEYEIVDDTKSNM